MSQIIVTCTDLPEPDWKPIDETQPGSSVCRARIPDHLPHILKYRALLSQEELQRSDNYHHDKDRHRFIICRGILRLLVGRHLGLSPDAIMFGKTAGKKPIVINATSRVIEFNVSHAGEWILIALSPETIGVDVEYLDETFLFDDMAAQVFAQAERDYLYTTALPLHTFYKVWSRKECLLKGSGKGIGENLPHTICLDGQNSLDSLVIGSEYNWMVQTFMVADKYVGNIAYTQAPPPDFFHIAPAAFDYLRL